MHGPNHPSSLGAMLSNRGPDRQRQNKTVLEGQKWELSGDIVALDTSLVIGPNLVYDEMVPETPIHAPV